MKKVTIVIVVAFLTLYVISCTHDRNDESVYEFGIDNGEVKDDDVNAIDNGEVKDDDI